MVKRNIDIRVLARKAGVQLWRVAEKIGISENALYYRLRYELTEEQRAEIVAAIKELEQEDNL